jgi:hypothetical protein
MDFSLALSYPLRAPEWGRKILLAGLLSLIPVLGPVLVLGWSLGITRQVITQGLPTLPEFDLARDLLRGLKIWGIGLIYGLPILVVVVPLGIGFGVTLLTDDGQAATILALTALCMVALLIVYSLMVSLALPAAYVNFLIHEEQFVAGLNIKEIMSLIRRRPEAYFLVWIGGIMCAFITLFGLAGCVIGVMFSGSYALMVMAHLYGQAYREAEDRSILPL